MVLDGKGSSDFLHKPLFVRAQEQDIRDALKNEWFSPSAAAARISGAQIADEVTRYSTLAELDEDQVEEGFWLGHALGEIRWRQIDLERGFHHGTLLSERSGLVQRSAVTAWGPGNASGWYTLP